MAAAVVSTNPFRPTEVVAERAEVSPDAAPGVIAEARQGFRRWGETSAAGRAQVLQAISEDVAAERDELSRLIVDEVGKPITEARAEVDRTVAIIRYNAQLALLPEGETLPAATPGSLLYTRRKPLGVVLVVAPWNFPLAIPAWKAIPALACGNAVVLKPASPAVGVASALERILNRHLPAGAFQLAAGGAALVERLLDDPGTAAVTFTGSTAVGRAIAMRAVSAGKPAQCEMGGQNASVVLADADLPVAASVIAHAAMGYAGQKCTATSRVIVERSVLAEFRDLLVAATEDIRVGDPGDERTVVGPVISAEAVAAVRSAVAESSGAVLVGGRPVADTTGHLVAPTLVEVADPATDRLAREEVFGPVAAVLAADSLDDAVRIANAVPQGLSAAVFTRDLDAALAATRRLEAGLVRVNSSTAGVDFHAPFGGVKESSFGPREQGLAAREFFTETTTVLINPSHL